MNGDADIARKGKSTEEIIQAVREAEVRIAQGETAGMICRSFGIRGAAMLGRLDGRKQAQAAAFSIRLTVVFNSRSSAAMVAASGDQNSEPIGGDRFNLEPTAPIGST